MNSPESMDVVFESETRKPPIKVLRDGRNFDSIFAVLGEDGEQYSFYKYDPEIDNNVKITEEEAYKEAFGGTNV